ncbi:MAG: enoyl-CoA hydratase-related protein [Rikenellaceae bacterium]
MSQEQSEGIIFEKEGRIAKIIINRPSKMNSITKEMGEELNRVARIINQDSDIAVVLLTSVGERSFSTGSDIKLLHQYGTPFELRNREDYCAAIRSIRKPVVAKVRGYALGGGLELLLTADIRYTDPTATFAVSEVHHGWTSGSGATQHLGRLMSYNQAAELVLTGKKFDAEEAYRLGIINDIIPSEELDAHVDGVLAQMSEQSTIAMQLIKQNLRSTQNIGIDAGLQYENDLFAFSFTTDDAKEGQAAFAEKRKPVFTK